MDTLRVLVVDDEQGMCLGVERALRRFQVSLDDLDSEVHFEVIHAVTGSDGLAKIASFKPDILLLDHKLPDMTGLDILDQIGNRDGDMLTVMITAYASLDTAVQATKRGAYDFLAKPFTPEEIRGAVRKATRHLLLQRQARRLAHEKRQVRFQFISVLAHEMKSPLAAVEGYLQLIRAKPLGDQIDPYNDMLNRSLIRLEGMRKLIHDLLDLTAIESGKRHREFDQIRLRDVVSAAVESVLPQAQQHGITVTMNVPEQLSLRADRSEMDIVLNNLVSNAVKYNRDGGQVSITAEALEPDHIRLTVSDTGIGMSPEESQRLFHDFARIKNDKTRNILGSGLGLSTVKKIVQLYDGSVTVSSVPDEGTTFNVVLHTSSLAASAEPHPENSNVDIL